MRLIEISPGCDVVTAVFNSELATGESFEPPVAVGFYKGQSEVFVMHAGAVLNIQNDDIADFCKQLKRTAKLANEQAEP